VIATAVHAGAKNIGSPVLWAGFLAGVLVLLALDLRISSRRGHGARFREAIGWSLFWIALSLGFGFWIWIIYGGEQGLQFFAGYLLEKSLSVDNLFVFVLLFQAFAIPAEYQHRVLFWGVLGALVLRGGLILAGVALVHRFHWIIAVFGAVLVYTAAKIALHRDGEEERAPTDNVVVRMVRKSLPMTATIEGPEFFVRRPISSSRSTRSPPCSPSRTTPSWCSPATFARSSGSVLFISWCAAPFCACAT